ncbi:MAG TPA: GDP-mannose 4,6-dehydratase [Candidatus Dormibacteraeota bacterium]|nr:GDP-mannose 4,6-dehydratase [Candidatus Dormibacteraeota bacterium]
MRALVTGATGFVGGHLTELLEANGADVRRATRAQFEGTQALDLRGIDVVFHLAAQSFVPDAIASPMATYEANVMGTARLARSIAVHAAQTGERPRLVFASSAEVYGDVSAEHLPLCETARTNPRNPYAASKAAAEAILIGERTSFGLDVVIGRAFNAIGPGQRPSFAIASFAAQVAQIARGAAARIAVGNLDAQRDFLDVRDVAAAYVALAQRGVAGESYNICSGVPRSLRSMLDELVRIAGITVEIIEEETLIREADTPILVGDNTKLRTSTQWSPKFELTTSLADALSLRAKMPKPS